MSARHTSARERILKKAVSNLRQPFSLLVISCCQGALCFLEKHGGGDAQQAQNCGQDQQKHDRQQRGADKEQRHCGVADLQIRKSARRVGKAQRIQRGKPARKAERQRVDDGEVKQQQGDDQALPRPKRAQNGDLAPSLCDQDAAKGNLPELQAELDRLNYSWQKGRIKSVEEYDRRYDAIMVQIDAD